VTRDEAQVSVGGLLALDQFLRDPWSSLTILDFDNLSKEERKTKQRLRDLVHFLGPFWDLGICNGYGNIEPMGLAILRPIF
jgi:hypothetical protein